MIWYGVIYAGGSDLVPSVGVRSSDGVWRNETFGSERFGGHSLRWRVEEGNRPVEMDDVSHPYGNWGFENRLAWVLSRVEDSRLPSLWPVEVTL